ncbi:Proteasome maturation protein [Nymphon striatum]|nr:Proteasome maturation protein [Nymphon striatum]
MTMTVDLVSREDHLKFVKYRLTVVYKKPVNEYNNFINVYTFVNGNLKRQDANLDLQSFKPGAKVCGKTANIEEGSYVLCRRFGNVRGDLDAAHPLEESEKDYLDNQTKLNLQMLQRIQGLHAPMRILMEQKAAKQIQRLPCLPSSNLSVSLLQDKLEMIGPEDIFNRKLEFCHPLFQVFKAMGIRSYGSSSHHDGKKARTLKLMLFLLNFKIKCLSNFINILRLIFDIPELKCRNLLIQNLLISETEFG